MLFACFEIILSQLGPRVAKLCKHYTSSIKDVAITLESLLAKWQKVKKLATSHRS